MASRFKRKSLSVKSNQKKLVSKNNGNGNGNGKLTANQKIFADEWLIDRNGTRAYKVAYPNTKRDIAAATSAANLLRILKVDVYINAKLELIKQRAEINQDRVLERYKRLADYYINDLFNDDGTMKPFSDIPKKTLYAIGGFKQSHKTITEGDKITIIDRIKEFKLADKKASLDSISRYLGMFAKDNEQKNNPGGSSVAIIGQTIRIKLTE